MKQKLLKTAAGVAIAGATMFAANNAFAQALTSIAESWHNLGSGNSKTGTPNGGPNVNKSMATGEICVFCHTPHGGDVSAAVPIWNRKLNDPAVYESTRYRHNNTTTYDAQEDVIGSVTIACLSCHDGAQAIDALINAPGSGFYTDKDTVPFGDPAYYAWAAANRISGSDITNGALSTGIVQNLTTDLRDDHPVSMQYGGGGVTGAAGTPSGATLDPDFTQAGQTRTIPNSSGADVDVTLMGQSHSALDTVFWIERSDSLKNGAAAGRDRNDVVLYTRNFNGAVQPFVECGSCHDPHNVDNPTFLRTSNGIPADGGQIATWYPEATTDPASGLCLTCHDK